MTQDKAIKYLQQIYPNGGHCWLDEQRIEAISMAVKALQEEPVSDDFTKALAECIHQAQCSVVDPLVHAEVWKEELVKLAKCEEPVSDDLEKVSDKYSEDIESFYLNDMFDRGDIKIAFKCGAKWQKTKDESTTEDLGEYINELSKQFPEVSFAKLSRIAVRVAKWQKKQIEEVLLSEVLPCFMHGGEADEVVAKLDEVLNQKK